MSAKRSKREPSGIPLSEILDNLAKGATIERLLELYPDLDESDIQACLLLTADMAGRSSHESRSTEPAIPGHMIPLIPATNPIRDHLITATLEFVRRLIGAGGEPPLTGVIRIALIGSLATTKPDPKDIDLLLTISDNMELAPLAARVRRLKARAQELDRDADVFLVNPGGEYIGRVCNRRDCRPGARIRCHALHCGQRPFLHDDLQIVTLSSRTIISPPVDLWPRLTVRSTVPDDLRHRLIEPMTKIHEASERLRR